MIQCDKYTIYEEWDKIKKNESLSVIKKKKVLKITLAEKFYV